MPSMDMEKMERLRERVYALFRAYDALKADNAALREALSASERDSAELRDRIKKLGREKGAVKEKVDGLLNRLEGLS